MTAKILFADEVKLILWNICSWLVSCGILWPNKNHFDSHQCAFIYLAGSCVLSEIMYIALVVLAKYTMHL